MVGDINKMMNFKSLLLNYVVDKDLIKMFLNLKTLQLKDDYLNFLRVKAVRTENTSDVKGDEFILLNDILIIIFTNLLLIIILLI